MTKITTDRPVLLVLKMCSVNSATGSSVDLFCYAVHTQTAFTALTLLVGRQEEHPAFKNWVMRCWCGCLSGARCRLRMVQLMPLHPKTLSSLVSFKSKLLLPFWYQLTQVVLEKRPLNGCSSSSVHK